MFEGQGEGKCNIVRTFDSSLPFCLPQKHHFPFLQELEKADYKYRKKRYQADSRQRRMVEARDIAV